MQYSLGRARLFNLLAVPLSSPSLRRPFFSLRSEYLSSSTSTVTRTCWQLPRRPFSSISYSPDDLFNYTSGRWLVNNELRVAERRREFDVEELCRLAAQSVGRSAQDIDTFVKLAEGGFNRTFLITMHDGFEMVARIPFPITGPKFYAIASEVATMRFLRDFGLPIPEVYDYSPSADNAAKTEYIFMEFVKGTKLADVFQELEEPDIVSVLRQFAQLESGMMSIPFPAGGSLYYTSDLEKVGGRKGIPLDDGRFCIGPEVRLDMWRGRRAQLDVDRGPYENAEALLLAVARKELAYLEQFGRPMLPFQRERWETYEYKEQSPADHIRNLERYLLIAPTIAQKPSLRHFRIRHPDLQPSNVIVSDAKQLNIVSLLDWQHTVILPPCLLAGIPRELANYNDPVSQARTPPSLPPDMDTLDGVQQHNARWLYHRQLVHFHYLDSAAQHNFLHYAALSDPAVTAISRLFDSAAAPWEGETHDMQRALIQATEMWDRLAGEGVPCPIAFDAEERRAAAVLEEKLEGADEFLDLCQKIIGFGPDMRVPADHYEAAVATAARFKQELLTRMEDPEVRATFDTHWFLNDSRDETDYL